jgi:mitochondrial fission protein ELM1
MDAGTAVTRAMETEGNLVGQPRGDPLVWLILSDKTGDNAQLIALAGALPWPCRIKRIVVRKPYVLGKPRVSASLHHIDPVRSDPLEPPWPDLVITIGRRMSMVALWIREQAGGRARIALIGAPKRLADRFDLTVVSEQYRQADRPNLMRITYPLQRIDEAVVAAEADARRGEFERLPRPLTAVLVGGSTKAVRFDAAVADRLAHDVAELAGPEQGTLFVTTSRRTPPSVVEVLERRLPAGAILYKWTADGHENPYRALLGLADRFVVTSDSLSMLMEIARLGRPLAIYPLPGSSWLARAPFGAPLGARGEAPGLPQARMRRIASLADTIARRLAAVGHHRDLTAIPQLLVRDGFAVWFGQPFRLNGGRLPDELSAVAARIIALAESHRGGAAAGRVQPGMDRESWAAAP